MKQEIFEYKKLIFLNNTIENDKNRVKNKPIKFKFKIIIKENLYFKII